MKQRVVEKHLQLVHGAFEAWETSESLIDWPVGALQRVLQTC